MDQVQLENREVIYKILSTLFYKPTEDTLQMLYLLHEIVQETDQELSTITKKLTVEAERHVSDLKDLIIDHTKLFIGSTHALASPYAAIYLEGKWEVMGDSTSKTLQYYKEAGLEIKEDFHELPDHIAVELEFVYYLIYKYLEEKEEKYVLIQQKFIDNMLSKWVLPFTKLIEEHAETDFYRLVGELLACWIEKETKEIQQV